MTSSPSAASAAWLSGLVAPLVAKFGDGLTINRTGNMVCWGYDGQSAVVEFVPNSGLRVTFIDSERIDAVSASPAVAAYRTGSAYALNSTGCSRMVADLVDFFSGVREPRFIFVDAYPR